MDIKVNNNFEFNIEDVFPVVTNTSLFTKLTSGNVPELSFVNDEKEGSIAIGKINASDSTFEYQDKINNWIKPYFYQKHRTFSDGLIKKLIFTIELFEKAKEQTEVVITMSLEGDELNEDMHDGMKGGIEKFLTACKSIINSSTKLKEYGQIDKNLIDKDLREKTDEYKEKILFYEKDQSKVEHFLDCISTLSDEQLIDINPFEFAERWSFNNIELLKMFLIATKVGLFDLTWNVHCPSCSSVVDHYRNLVDSKGKAACGMCNIDFNTNFDDSIEVNFDIHPDIRQIDKTLYCSTYPETAQDTYVNYKIPAGETKEIELNLTEGHYFFFYPNYPDKFYLTASENNEKKQLNQVTIKYTDNDKPISKKIKIECETTFKIENQSSRTLEWKLLSDNDYTGKWVSGALVTSLQDFRDLFSSEILSKDTSLSIKNISLMFTDIKESTSMYETIGDAPAYRHVRDHFRIMTETVKKHNGSIVKTIGDAIMGAFKKPIDALKSALEIHKKFEEFNNKEDVEKKIIIRMGIHSGPVISVNSNDRLDYFGTTVNKSARLEGQSHGGDIVISHDFFQNHNVKLLLKELKSRNLLSIQKFEANLKGLKSSNKLYRIIIKNLH